MAISPLGSSLANTLGNPSSTTAGKAAAGSIGKELLATLAQAQTASGASADPLWQDQVSLSSAGQGASAPLTYDAKGLLQQLQNNMRNNPLWQTDSSDSDNTQSLWSAPPSAASGTSTPQAQALAAIGNGNGNNTDWAKMLKQNPALAGVMVDSQTAQSMISMLA